MQNDKTSSAKRPANCLGNPAERVGAESVIRRPHAATPTACALTADGVEEFVHRNGGMPRRAIRHGTHNFEMTGVAAALTRGPGVRMTTST